MKAADYPDRPVKPTLVSQSPSEIVIEWVEPDNGGLPLTEYLVYWDGDEATAGSGVFTLVETITTPESVTQHTNSAVTPGRLYQFKVVASNEVGDSPMSLAVTIKAA